MCVCVRERERERERWQKMFKAPIKIEGATFKLIIIVINFVSLVVCNRSNKTGLRQVSQTGVFDIVMVGMICR